MSRIRVVERLIKDFPCLTSQTEEILNDFGHVYLHLVFGDVFNPYFISLLTDPSKNSLELTTAGGLIEWMAGKDTYTQEVVVTTILERLLDDYKATQSFIPYAGPLTLSLLKQLGYDLLGGTIG